MGKATLTASESIAKMGQYKAMVGSIAHDLPKLDWEPLKSWPFKQHDRAAEMKAYRSMPSEYNK